MRFRFQELFHRKETVNVELTVEVTPWLERNPDVISTTPLQVRIEVRHEAGMAIASGSLSNTVTYCCSRCLEPFTESLEVPFQESFYPTENEPDDPEDHVHAVQDEGFELLPWIEEAFLVELPFVPVCRPTCEGLCPECGVNRNVTRCKCQNKRIDPRLLGLSEWLDQHPEDRT
jgi:uncharacterized protein